MTPLAFDTETALIRPALLAPPLVCVTWQQAGAEPQIAHWADAEPHLRAWLTDPNVLLVGHFIAYDMAVICAQFPELIPLVFAAYKANHVTCTKKRQQLLDIAGGVFRGRPGEKGKWIMHDYTLDALSRRHLGKPMQKDGWRLEYGNFRDVPLKDWPAKARELQIRATHRMAEIVRDYNISGLSRSDLPEAIQTECRNLDAIFADAPEGVIRYPLDDASTTLGVYQAQEKHAEFLKDQYRQAYADFCLYLSSAWGLRTNPEGVEALRAELTEAHGELVEEMKTLGLVRSDGTRDMKKVKRLMIDTCRENALALRRTDAHTKPDKHGVVCADTIGDACDEHVSLDSDACEAAVSASGEDSHGETVDGLLGTPLSKYAEFVALTKMISNDVRMLEQGITYPVHTRYDIAETGRTTSSKPNIQNLNTGRYKKGETRTSKLLRPGVRQAFVPRPGKVFAQADFPQLELYTLAQWCIARFGFSKLGDMLNAGLDPHMAVAAKILGISYEEAAANKKRTDVDAARQVGKAFNFGKPGGMGDTKFRTAAHKMYGVELTDTQCKAYTAQWYETLPEMRLHFDWARDLFPEGVERATVATLYTDRVRGGTTYCAACNNGFQALGSDCFKAALCLVSEAQYCDTASPLFGSRTVACVHDEMIGECDDGPGAHDAAYELARLMVKGANRYLPDVPILMERMDPVLMRVWSKEAKQVFSDGRLVPWAPA